MDFYDVLQVSQNASQDDIRKSYQQLILRHHPDKNEEKSESLHIFLKIDQAYKVLKNPVTRKEYDSKRFQQTARCQMIIHDTIARQDFLFDESNKVFYSVCKCGGWYILEEEGSSLEDEFIICCDECSLVIKVLNKNKVESWNSTRTSINKKNWKI